MSQISLDRQLQNAVQQALKLFLALKISWVSLHTGKKTFFCLKCGFIRNFPVSALLDVHPTNQYLKLERTHT